MYQPFFTKQFEKQLKKIPQKEQIKILDKISGVLSDPQKYSLRLIATKPPIYRLRVGEYRIFFTLDNPKIMKIVDVLRRTTQTYR